MRIPAALALASVGVVALLVLPAQAGPTGTSGSYAVHVLPDPTGDVSPYGPCGLADSYVAGNDVGSTTRTFVVPAGRTLSAEIVPMLNVFAGDVGLNWSLRVNDATGHELTRSAGPAWRTQVSYRVARTQQLRLVACNLRGHPDATVTYSLH